MFKYYKVITTLKETKLVKLKQIQTVLSKLVIMRLLHYSKNYKQIL
jgi:hypothetical protein